MLLKPCPVSTANFFYESADRRFIAEASDLGLPELFGRVWDDAADEGLTLISSKTGHEIVFSVTEEARRDGDILFWRLESVDSKFGTFEMKIFND